MKRNWKPYENENRDMNLKLKQNLRYSLYAVLGAVIRPIACIWNKTLAGKFNYWIMKNVNNRYCIFRFWNDPNKPTWEKVA
jgi:hypothetical protein